MVDIQNELIIEFSALIAVKMMMRNTYLMKFPHSDRSHLKKLSTDI